MKSMNRRNVMAFVSGGVTAGLFLPSIGCAQSNKPRQGVVAGSVSAHVGEQIINNNGGNAVDGLIAAALASGVTELASTGIAGYGGHITIAMRNKPVISIDCNSTAPMTVTHDMFADPDMVQAHMTGWLSAGVPGTLAGLDLALKEYGTLPLSEVMAPAIKLAEEGFPVTEGTARLTSRYIDQFRSDPGSAKLLLNEGEALIAGSTFTNPDLAKMLKTLASDESVDRFYRGDIAHHIATEFQKNGGLVTADDMAAYEARIVEPLRMDWLGQTIYTAPLTAGGATIMETLSILRALDPSGEHLKLPHARLEALRIAWDDRLRLFGDPEHLDAPLDYLFSEQYAKEKAALVAEAIKQERPVDIVTDAWDMDGTIHLSAADTDGNFAAITFTHGGAFGAKVTVEGLGLILGHGVSRFDPRPGYPNSPGPGKRPLHNMCPTIVTKDRMPWVALGGRGARRIPNSVFNVLVEILMGNSPDHAVAAPRMHTTGSLDLILEEGWSTDQLTKFENIGYNVSTGRVASVNAAFNDPITGKLSTAIR